MVYLFSNVHGQNNYVGTYKDYSKNTIQIFSDFTFKHFSGKPNFPWSKGEWSSSNDTLYLVCVPIYDTLIYYDTLCFADSPKRIKTYILVLSDDEESNSFTKNDLRRDDRVILPQSCNYLPQKLFYKKNVLYYIDATGKIIKKKYKSKCSNKKASSGLVRVKY